jgi:rubrerythrin
MNETLPSLQALDADGAIQETMAAAPEHTRAAFLKRAGGGLAGGGLLMALAADAASAATPRDVSILNFALTLEYLEAAFYAEALRKGALRGRLAAFADHEATHVVALRKALGSAAVKKPRFDFQSTTSSAATFTATSITLEDTGVKAYKGQAPRIQSDAVLKAALAIHAVEARHASWIRDLAGQSPAPVAFDTALTMGQVLAAVAKTGFIVAAPAPRFTG